MPTCNSVRIPGKKAFMLVLFNQVGANAPDNIHIGRELCEVWKNYRSAPKTYDFAPIWYSYYKHDATQNQIADLTMHLMRAWNVISDTLATMDSVGRASSVVAKLSSNYTYGICKQRWSTTGVAGGAWTIGGGALHKKDEVVLTSDIFRGCLGADNWQGRSRLVGYNFGYHSAWMSFAQSDSRTSTSRLNDSKNPDLCEIYWSTVDYCNPKYTVREATSFYRMCLAHGLIETTHQTIPMMTPHGFQNWVYSHSILLAMSVTDFINQSAIPPTSWYLSTESYDVLTASTMANANELLTLGLARPSRMEEVTEAQGPEWGWDKIVDYYSFPYSDSEYNSMLPINCSSLLQWLNKTEQKIPHPTPGTMLLVGIVHVWEDTHR